ncbi:hypothetical protein [Flagellimonas pacifica]|uniref:Winged helix-turn-helix domain-containing protein n=1 Tax=Flagellimonas pacifica TaxID=1247520 RepID=A0A285MQR8_9FLAO|nr:hypothetical protein [Allomuricauda parva]SNY99488.1 hypothetical protein SAMN06265377_1295 [Allomuricauda parva]
MENKNRYYKVLKENNDRLNEIDLGEKIGLSEDETRAIIAQLLAEHKIVYAKKNICNYQIMKNRIR